MAAIFPPAAKGGVAPGANVCNGFTPVNSVIGEGPLYISGDCTTVLTDCQLNAITSEILAAVDRLGFSFNTNSLTNLGDALRAALDALTASVAADIANRVAVSGDTMTGPLVLSGDPTAALEAVPRQFVDAIQAAITAAYTAADAALQAALQTQINDKVNRAGDGMSGPLSLVGNPEQALHAAPKQYVDGRVNRAGDTMTGQLFLSSSTPTLDNEAVTKLYVDTQVAAVSAGTRALCLMSDTEPSVANRINGVLWWNTLTGNMQVWYDDGTSAQWVQAADGGYGTPQGATVSSTETEELLARIEALEARLP